MIKKLFFLFLILGLPLFLSGCLKSRAGNENREVVSIEDEFARNGNEIIIDDSKIEKNSLINVPGQSSQEAPRPGPDDSEIVTMYDGFGNKTETRYFKSHPQIKIVVLRTSATGEKQAFVYSYGKEVQTLSGAATTDVLTSSGNVIAVNAGLSDVKNLRDTRILIKKNPSSQPLQPLPSSEFPVVRQPQNVQPAEEPVNVQQSVDAANPNPAAEQIVPAAEKPAKEK